MEGIQRADGSACYRILQGNSKLLSIPTILTMTKLADYAYRVTYYGSHIAELDCVSGGAQRTGHGD